MPRYVAFLRAINVGGHVVKMEALRQVFESMKFKRVETFIASGNVIFESGQNAAAFQKKIEDSLRQALGYEVATFIRTDAEVSAIARYAPFPAAAIDSAATLCVAFLAAPLDRESEQKALALRTAVDDFHVHGRELYWLGGMKQSESTFSNAVLEKVLGVRATLRNITTVQKLAAKYPPAVAAVEPNS